MNETDYVLAYVDYLSHLNGNGRLHSKLYTVGDGSGPSSKPTAGAPLVQTTLTNSRYPAWHIYMPNEGV